jgi:tetratricopeptide (TPR) repeat protein
MLEKLEKQVRAKQKAIFDQTVSDGDRWTEKKELEKASAAYAKAFGMNPTDADLLKKISNVDQAIKTAAAAKYAARGQKAMKEKDYLTALVEWSKVLELLPADSTAQNMVASANLALTTQKLSTAASKNSDVIDQYFRQGLQALQSGRYSAALELWKKILNLEPNNPHVTQYLRLTQTKLEDLVEELLRLADQEWENEQYVNAVKKWRQVLELTGNQPQAEAKLAANRAKLAELADANYRLGVQLYVQNDLDAALAVWQNVLVFDPANPKALEHLEQVKRKRKELNALK